ncbi:MAG: YcbK family protein [Steroidobacteraceae bacterium]
MKWTRRRLLQAGGAVAGITAAGVWGRPARAAGPEFQAMTAKRIALVNLHTAETLDLEFFRGGDYVPDSLAAIRVLLRDFRNDEQHAIDPKLMDYLYDVAQHLRVDPVFRVISGYRSPQTNETLRERSSGVARRSLHLEGRAIDVRLAGVDCADLAGRALEMTRGGVGYYRQSDFVHLDTGAFRTWKG